jgi:Mrp family chromosome partitioning ATPase
VLSVADAAILSNLVDGVIFVVKASTTPRPPIQHALHQLTEVNARIFGCILNAVDFEKENYYYSTYRYYYHYYYGDEGSKKLNPKPPTPEHRTLNLEP